MKRITILAAAGALVATPALGAWAAVASTGGDDKAPAVHSRIADDSGHHQRHTGTDDKIVVHLRHGADDAAGHQRHSGEAEPGDDNGGHGGDDNGGHHGGGSDD